MAAIKAKVAKVAFIVISYMIDVCSPVLWVAALLCCLCLKEKKGFRVLMRSSLSVACAFDAATENCAIQQHAACSVLSLRVF